LFAPLEYIEQRLFGDTSGKSCRDFCHDHIDTLVFLRIKDENERSGVYLKSFFERGTLPGALAFGEVLQGMGLDYSLDSLDRIDGLLRQIHIQQNPNYINYVNQSGTSNFLLLIGYYLGATIARLSGSPTKWLSYDDVKKSIKDVDFAFESDHVCAVGGKLFFVLGAVTEVLFKDKPELSCRTYVEKILRSNPARLIDLRRSRTSAAAATGLDPAWRAAIQQAGFLAAHGMFMVEEGSMMQPTVLQQSGGKGTFLTLAGDQVDDAAIDRGIDLLERNPSQLPFQNFIYDGYANLPSGRIDALTIHLRCYGKNPLRAVITLPYRHAQNPKGFAVHLPKLIESSAQGDFASVCCDAFYAGVDSYKSSTFSWNARLDDTI
jgi:hypothetical protein